MLYFSMGGVSFLRACRPRFSRTERIHRLFYLHTLWVYLYLEYAYHYPGEHDYLRFFVLSSGQHVIATVRASGTELTDNDTVANFLLPPKRFVYSKSAMCALLEHKDYAVLEGLQVGIRE